MTAGSVVTVDFQGATGVKRRPDVVISTDAYHDERPHVILAVITSQIEKATSKTDVILKDWKSAGLTKPSAVRIFLGTSDGRNVRKIGSLSPFDWAEVKKRLRLSIEFE